MKFTVTLTNVKENFATINRRIFNNQLSIPEIDIDKSNTEWGAYIPYDLDCPEEWLFINIEFPSKKKFLHTLTHEMIHIWQWQVLKNGNCGHDDKFMHWVNILVENYNYDYSQII